MLSRLYSLIQHFTRLRVLAMASVLAVSVPGTLFYIDEYVADPDDFIHNGCWHHYRLPSNTLQDIATYADQLSVINVVSDRRVPVDTPPGGNPDAEYSRRVARVEIERTLWRREGAPQAPETFELAAWGPPPDGRVWITGDTRLEVGSKYLAPLTLFHIEHKTLNDGKAWSPIARCVTFKLDGDVIAEPPFLTYTQPQPIAGQLVGMHVEEFATHIANTPPNPIAVPYMHLEPDDRVAAVGRQMSATASAEAASGLALQ